MRLPLLLHRNVVIQFRQDRGLLQDRLAILRAHRRGLGVDRVRRGLLLRSIPCESLRAWCLLEEICTTRPVGRCIYDLKIGQDVNDHLHDHGAKITDGPVLRTKPPTGIVLYNRLIIHKTKPPLEGPVIDGGIRPGNPGVGFLAGAPRVPRRPSIKVTMRTRGPVQCPTEIPISWRVRTGCTPHA